MMQNSLSARRWKQMLAVVTGLAVAVSLAGCSSSPKSQSESLKKDGTFTVAIGSDPASLDPQSTLDGTSLTLAAFSYDSLVARNASGEFVSQLASSWKQNGNAWTFVIKEGVLCHDGSTFTAADVVSNIAYIEEAKNASPLLGTYLPAGVTAKSSADSVTLTLPGASPFFLNGLALVPMVCKAAIADRKKLATSTDGTGAYTLTTAANGNEYTYSRSKGYTWGPGGATNTAAGSPAKVVFRVVASPSTQANLLLSKGINAASISSADQARLKAKHLFQAGYTTPLGEMFFNESAGHATADPAVRRALTEALSLPEIRATYTGGAGTAPSTFTPGSPPACKGDSISADLPEHSLSTAKEDLQAAGWIAGADGVRVKGGKRLTVSLNFLTDLVPGAANASELAAAAWKSIGVAVTPAGTTAAQSSNVLFGSGAWDVAWTGLGVSTPNQLVSVFSGAAPPNGSNFGHINNATYTTQVAIAAKASDPSNGCANWLAAERALVKNADVIPFANVEYLTYGSGAKFAFIDGNMVPTSIRLTK